jgi:hypothetical protein
VSTGTPRAQAPASAVRFRRNVDRLTAGQLRNLRAAFEATYGLADDRGYAHHAGIHGLPLPIGCDNAPGERYPDRATLTGTAHHVLLVGAADDHGAARLRRRWRGLVEVVHATGDHRRVGLSTSGALLVRPDGNIGFRAAPADAAGLAALDAHLDTYLVPA